MSTADQTRESRSAPAATPEPGGATPRWLRERPELVLSPLALIVVIVLWHLVTSVWQVFPPVIMPSPRTVLDGFVELVTASWFPQHVWATTLETVVGFAIAVATACTAAVIMDQIALVRRVVYPYIVVLQVVPSIVLAPIFIIWFGFGVQSKIVVAASTAFFVILVNTLAGLSSVPENSRLLMHSLVASRGQVFFKLTLPTALPYVFAAFKAAVTLALIGALVGEFITARVGLGRLMTQFSFAIRQDMMFATVLVIGALGIALYGLVAFIEKKAIWWR
jgi:NitT/TauT family transport system permease protein